MTERQKIFFRIDVDESGYPPVATESLWATPTPAAYEYILDNIPFFQSVATLGDTVAVEQQEGRLWYQRTVGRSNHSLIRIVALTGADPAAVGKELGQLGCTWELDAVHHLIAVDVPPEALGGVQKLIGERAASGMIDYEEAILR